jgi:hypothetical protein
MSFQLGQPPEYETWRIALTIGGSLVTLASLVVTAVVLVRTKTASYWKEERDAAVEKVKRVTEENTTLKEKVAVLEAQRDLTSVQEGQTAIVRALDALSQHETERYTKLTEAITQNTKMLMGFQSQMAGVFDAQRQAASEMVLLLRDINNSTRA